MRTWSTNQILSRSCGATSFSGYEYEEPKDGDKETFGLGCFQLILCLEDLELIHFSSGSLLSIIWKLWEVVRFASLYMVNLDFMMSPLELAHCTLSLFIFFSLLGYSLVLNHPKLMAVYYELHYLFFGCCFALYPALLG